MVDSAAIRAPPERPDADAAYQQSLATVHENLKAMLVPGMD